MFTQTFDAFGRKLKVHWVQIRQNTLNSLSTLFRLKLYLFFFVSVNLIVSSSVDASQRIEDSNKLHSESKGQRLGKTKGLRQTQVWEPSLRMQALEALYDMERIFRVERFAPAFLMEFDSELVDALIGRLEMNADRLPNDAMVKICEGRVDPYFTDMLTLFWDIWRRYPKEMASYHELLSLHAMTELALYSNYVGASLNIPETSRRLAQQCHQLDNVLLSRTLTRATKRHCEVMNLSLVRFNFSSSRASSARLALELLDCLSETDAVQWVMTELVKMTPESGYLYYDNIHHVQQQVPKEQQKRFENWTRLVKYLVSKKQHSRLMAFRPSLSGDLAFLVDVALIKTSTPAQQAAFKESYCFSNNPLLAKKVKKLLSDINQQCGVQ
ncbi:hypothetical protein [Pleionea litopenaei]|uniref:Uncharacterized protein n=1 Tax=Pleionea litopenaei TaxID=3070815 RepID=A0AA51RTH0_9GAMM|nr:hypothetical protein [Pleionea sp. HL-JVS1]WMS87184.1 hypothetical protein Q9312_18420 [Pleionea sp. HL-JVS1]